MSELIHEFISIFLMCATIGVIILIIFNHYNDDDD